MAGKAKGEPAPDISLVDDHGPTTHRGLTYPLGRGAPGEGELIEIAPGVGWARLPLPGSLGHINVWALDDGEGVALVDTGLDIPAVREAWEKLLAGPLSGRPVTRVFVTHMHPDHVGLAGWLTERFGVKLWMTRGEWLFARMLTLDARDAPPPEDIAHRRAAGWDDVRIAEAQAKPWRFFASVVSPVPQSIIRLQDGQAIRIGARTWKVVTGNGHSPEHACLVDGEAGVMIAGDQVLPRITSNVSLSMSEPEGDPLGDWLASIAKLRQLSPDLLVLPSHGEPFTGLHARLDALRDGHLGRLDAIAKRLNEPKRAVDLFGVLFGRAIDDSVYGLATGEALAHLRRLEVEGRAVREELDGVWWYRSA
jgi:glyoxylase-like metal-dependent hydrolase (beta-lactamase superfamily II)